MTENNVRAHRTRCFGRQFLCRDCFQFNGDIYPHGQQHHNDSWAGADCI